MRSHRLHHGDAAGGAGGLAEPRRRHRRNRAWHCAGHVLASFTSEAQAPRVSHSPGEHFRDRAQVEEPAGGPCPGFAPSPPQAHSPGRAPGPGRLGSPGHRRRRTSPPPRCRVSLPSPSGRPGFSKGAGPPLAQSPQSPVFSSFNSASYGSHCHSRLRRAPEFTHPPLGIRLSHKSQTNHGSVD